MSLGVAPSVTTVRIVVARSAAEMPGPVTVPGVDRHRERGAERGGVLGDHHRQAELAQLLLGHRQADQAAPFGGHEVDRLGRDLLRGHAEVALVLAVLVVHDDDHAAGLVLGDRLLDGRDGAALAGQIDAGWRQIAEHDPGG